MKIIALFFIISTASFSQSALEKDSLEIWITGNFSNQIAHQIVSEKWPFVTKFVAGDVIDDYFIETINKHNKKIWESIGSKNLSDKYYFEVKIERKKVQEAMDIIDRNTTIIRLINQLKMKGRSIFTQVEKISNIEYLFSIFSFDLSNIKSTEILEAKAIINIKTNTIDISND